MARTALALYRHQMLRGRMPATPDGLPDAPVCPVAKRPFRFKDGVLHCPLEGADGPSPWTVQRPRR
jgi:hypothetical protein